MSGCASSWLLPCGVELSRCRVGRWYEHWETLWVKRQLISSWVTRRTDFLDSSSRAGAISVSDIKARILKKLGRNY